MRRMVDGLRLLALLVGILGTANAKADVISVNFNTATYNLASSTSAGLVPATNWNNVNVTSGSINALKDKFGASTTANISSITGSGYSMYAPGVTLATTDSGLNTVYAGGLHGTSASVAFTNIPYAQYDVYIYAAPDSTRTNTLNVGDGTTTYYYRSNGSTIAGQTSLTQITSTNSSSPTVAAATYAKLTGRSSSNITITMAGGVTGTIGNNLYGIQIVNTAVPEPGTLLLGGIAAACGGGGVWWRRRRRPVADNKNEETPAN